MRKRVHRRRRINRKSRGKNGNRAGIFVMAVFCSVMAGYITANYIIGPAVGLESQTVFSDFINNRQQTVEKEVDKTENNNETDVIQDQVQKQNESGYALQYGSFSSNAAAQQCVNDLASKGIKTEIIEKDSSFKVIGEVFDTKEEAESHKETYSSGEDIFITEIP